MRGYLAHVKKHTTRQTENSLIVRRLRCKSEDALQRTPCNAGVTPGHSRGEARRDGKRIWEGNGGNKTPIKIVLQRENGEER